jgi:hypothetical protein
VIVDEPVRGSFAYPEQPGLLGMQGLDQLQLFVDGKLPAPPLTRLSGLVVDAVEPGASTWSIPASPWWQTAAGVFGGGTLGFVADAALVRCVDQLPRSCIVEERAIGRLGLGDPRGPTTGTV